MYKNLDLEFVGVAPLVMHSSTTVDPINKITKAIKEVSGKRMKVDSDYEELARLEYIAGLYVHDGLVVLPSYVLEAALVSGAKKSKMGVQAKSGLFIEHHAKLIYDGPTSAKDLWADESFRLSVPVKVGTSRVIRTRPIFKNWSCVVNISYMDDVLNEKHVLDFAEQCGMLCGLCDWRPKFGRFKVNKI